MTNIKYVLLDYDDSKKIYCEWQFYSLHPLFSKALIIHIHSSVDSRTSGLQVFRRLDERFLRYKLYILGLAIRDLQFIFLKRFKFIINHFRKVTVRHTRTIRFNRCFPSRANVSSGRIVPLQTRMVVVNRSCRVIMPG